MKALDLQSPRWFIELADPVDLKSALLSILQLSSIISAEERIASAEKILRYHTASRLFIALRAAVHSNLLQELSK
jgi:hypothetical protein